jgi:hypothetical protein
MANLVLLAEALPHTTYTPEHITWLLRHKRIDGKKVGGTWLVDLDSLKEYEQRMDELGSKKHNRYKGD